MRDKDKTKAQLIEELSALRKKVSALEDNFPRKRELPNPCQQIETRFADFLELVPAIVFEMAADGSVTFANQAAFDTFGYVHEDIERGLNVFDITVIEDREKTIDYLQRLVNGGNSETNEYRVICKDGNTIPIVVYSKAVKDENGNHAGFMCVALDISKQKRSEEAMRESEEKLRIMFNNIVDGISVIDLRTGKVVDANLAALRMGGWDRREEVAGLNAYELIAPGDREKAIEDLKRTLETGESALAEWTLMGKNGQEYICEDSSSVIYDSAGKPAYLVNVMRDITERKRMMQQLKQSEEKYRALAELERDVIFSVDARGYITALNSASRQWGYEPNELIGRHFLDLIPQEWQEKTAVELQNRLLQGGEITAETVVLDKDGNRRPMEYSAIVITQDGEYAGAQGICRDISERKAMEQTLRKNAAELEMILNSVPAFIYYKDVEGRIVRGNFTALTGIPEEKWKGKTVFELLPNLAETYHTDDMEVISTGKAKRNIIEPLETPKGIRWLQSHKLPTRNEEGNVSGIIGFSVDITERVEAEEALKQSEEKLRFMFESIADGITVTDLEGSIQDVNASTLRIFGYRSKDEVIGKDGLDFIDAEDRERAMQDLTALSYEGHTKIGEYRMSGKGNRKFHGEAIGSLLRDTAGNPAGAIVTIRDVTERKKLSESQLWESEEKRRIVFESIADGIVIMDLQGTIIDTNEAAYRMGQWRSKEDIIGKNGFSFISDKDRPKFLEDLVKVLEQRQSLTVQYVVKDKDGREYDSETVATLLRDTAGEPVGLVAVVRDISERKRMEQALRESEEMARGMLESAATGIYVVQNGRFRYISPLFEEITGYKGRELLGKRSLDYIHPDDVASVRQKTIDSLKGKSHLPHEFRFIRKDRSTVWVLEKVASIQYKGKRATIASFMDITEMKRVEAELEGAYEELKSAQDYMIQSERLRALGEMASGIAHDFNNILAVVLGRAQLALEDVADPKLKRDLQIIEQTAMDAATTVRRLQDFARVRVDRAFEPVDVNGVIEGAIHMVESRRVELKETAGINIDIVTDVKPVPPVMGDAAELREALLNIFFNAIDAMPKGGTITVSSSCQGEQVQFSVSDTGVGIPREVRGKIFEPFFTTRGSVGSGLGLSVTYGIVRRHNGTIDVDSVHGKGSKFTISLPVASGVEVAERKERREAVTRSARILMVDDDPEVRDVLKLMLEHLGHEVVSAECGEDAVNIFEAGDFELVVTDLGMPDISGREVASIVKEIRPGTPVILITGWGVQLNEDDMPEIDGMITKPFSKDILSAKIAELLPGESKEQ